jgi:hypothetical protein
MVEMQPTKMSLAVERDVSEVSANVQLALTVVCELLVDHASEEAGRRIWRRLELYRNLIISQM